MLLKKKICVFCGSSKGNYDYYQALASNVGNLIGKYDFDFVYGAGSTGLMGTCANSAKKSGAMVYGVIPNFLTKIEQPPNNINLKITSNMRTRKALMYKLSSLFIILPGGIGTLDECVEVLTLMQLKQLKNKKILILNFKNYWDHLFKLFKKMEIEGFVKNSFSCNFIKIKSIDELENFLKSFWKKRILSYMLLIKIK